MHTVHTLSQLKQGISILPPYIIQIILSPKFLIFNQAHTFPLKAILMNVMISYHENILAQNFYSPIKV